MAIQIAGLKPDARFAFINDTYEPMQITHNNKPCWVARGVAPRYLFHTGQGRWVVSKVMDDGYRCWAFVKADETSKDPSDCHSPWNVCGHDNQWAPDNSISCKAVAPSNDKFVQLRLTLDADMRQYGLIEKSDLKKLWRRLDYNGNNVVSLAEIDKMVVELTDSAKGVWPTWLNNKPALMRAYKKTILKDGDGDDWVEKKEFHALLLNIFWFNKLWLVFEQVDTGADRRIDVQEFIAGMSRLGLQLSDAEARQEFGKIDENGGGQVLFVEFCAYIRKRVNPDDHAEFDADIVSGEHCTRASYFKVGHHHGHGSHHHGSHHLGSPQRHHASPHIQSRDLDFSAMSASAGGGGGGGYGGSADTMGASSTQSSPSASLSTQGPTDTIRSHGTNSTLNHVLRPKSFADFDRLEDQIKAACKDHGKIKDMWHRLDYNGNGIVSLAEIDKWVVEKYPLLNHKPALMRCYKCTIATSSHHDDFVHSKDFKRLIVNIFYFNKLYWVFDECNGDDRRMTFPEFKMCLALCRCQISDSEAQRDFRTCDKNGGGMILFDEFCHYFASRSCPQGMSDFVDDGIDRSKVDGTAAVLHNARMMHRGGAY